jgi:hypothetical protein
MAGRKSKPGESAKETAEYPKVFKAAKHEAAGSLQPHMLYARKEIRRLVMERLSGGVKPRSRTEKEPFSYDVVDGHLYVRLQQPILRRETKAIIDPISASIKKIRSEWRESKGIKRTGLKRHEYPGEIALPSDLQVLWDEGMLPSEVRARELAAQSTDDDPEQYTEEGEEKPSKAILFTKFPLLALTSKMGCYSFNMPAGPQTKFYGTCPAAAYGFPMLKPNERPRASSKWYDKSATDTSKFLCSGCYGLKGLYGSPMIFTMMECRKQWVETMIQPKYRADFIKYMIKAIRMSQAQSFVERFFMEEMNLQSQIWSIPDPNYFRIHDVGDIFHEEYLQAWFEVIRECAKPLPVKRLGLTLPAIRFWMPTRAWMVPGKVSDHFTCMGVKKSCVPENLTLRPSAVHFGDPSPAIKGAKGMSMGAGATGIGQALTDADMKEAEKVVGKLYGNGGKGWICPAYLAPEKLGGGGAEWAAMGGKRKGLQLVGGACARAFGPDGEEPSPKGKGCRACWDRPDLKIVYPEH